MSRIFKLLISDGNYRLMTSLGTFNWRIVQLISIKTLLISRRYIEEMKRNMTRKSTVQFLRIFSVVFLSRVNIGEDEDKTFVLWGDIFFVCHTVHTSKLLDTLRNWQTCTAGTDRITEGDGRIQAGRRVKNAKGRGTPP